MFHSYNGSAHRQATTTRVLTAGLAVLVLSSCSDNSLAPAPSRPMAQGSGRVLGGQQPVVGAQVTIYAAGSATAGGGGYGQGDTVLVDPSVVATMTTDTSGAFSFPAVTCPDGDPPVYVVAVQGNDGSGNNPDLALSAGLAACHELAMAQININEVTTVASVWALSQFLDPSGVHLGAPSTNTVGLANAAGMIANLADVMAGQAATAPVSGVVPPAATVNTLANILSHCVNSDGGTSSPCAQLFSAAPALSGAASTTLAAALSIARNPGNSVAALFQIASSTDPFQTPQPLQTAPSDWTLPIQIPGDVVNPAVGLSIDAQGNVWIVTTASGALNELTPSGAVAPGSPFSGGGLMLPAVSRLVIDSNDNIWIATSSSNPALQALAVFNAEGQPLDGSPFNAASLETSNTIGSMAADASGNMWIVNPGGMGTLTEASVASGSFTSSSVTVADGPGAVPSFVGFDQASNVFTDYQFQAEITAQNPAGAALPGSPYAITPTQNGPILGAQDGSVWVLNIQLAPELTHLVPATDGSGSFTSSVISLKTVLPTSPALAQAAFDGRGQLWIVSSVDSNGKSSLVELDSMGNPATGSPFLNAQLSESNAMSIDASGNIWIGGEVASNGAVPVLVVVGAAAPVKTPVTGVALLP